MPEAMSGVAGFELRLPVIGKGPASIPSQLYQVQTVQTYRLDAKF